MGEPAVTTLTVTTLLITVAVAAGLGLLAGAVLGCVIGRGRRCHHDADDQQYAEPYAEPDPFYEQDGRQGPQGSAYYARPYPYDIAPKRPPARLHSRTWDETTTLPIPDHVHQRRTGR